VCENKKEKKKMMTGQNFLVEGWNIEGCVTKVIKQIVMDFGLLFLHKTKVFIL